MAKKPSASSVAAAAPSTPHLEGVVKGLYVGEVEHFAADTSRAFKIMSAIDKKPVNKVRLTKGGVEGDVQADLRHHGGPDRAVMQFDEGNYRRLAQADSALAPYCSAPRFGENISSIGMNEENLCIGDVIKMGSAVLQVAQPRRVCFKLNHRFKKAGFSPFTEKLGITGWLYRVLEEGEVSVGDKITLLSRPNPDLRVVDVTIEFFVKATRDKQFLQRMMDCNELAQRWRNDARDRMEKPLAIEYNTERLCGPEMTLNGAVIHSTLADKYNACGDDEGNEEGQGVERSEWIGHLVFLTWSAALAYWIAHRSAGN